MHFSWLGNTTIRIQAKPFDKEVTVLIDPYKHEEGASARNLSSDIALFTRGEKNSITLTGDPFTLSAPGECEVKGVLITAVQGHDVDDVSYRVDAEQMSVGHLGMINKPLTDEQIEHLSGVDILCVPVGGKDCFDAEAATKAINSLEPRVVIPMAFKSDNDPDATSVEQFLKQIGIVAGAAEKKVILKKKDLPQEDMKIVVLAKE